MPSSRATAISEEVSIVNVVRPSTSAGGQPAVGERVLHRLDGQLELGAAGLLGELGRADAGDGGLARQPAHRRCFGPRGERATSETGAGDVVAERDPAHDVDGRDAVARRRRPCR